MNKPIVSYRRIDQLKAIAFDCGFTNEDAKQFGKLSKTATWFAMLETYSIPSQVVDTFDTDRTNLKRSLLTAVLPTKTPNSSASSAKLLRGSQCWKLTAFLRRL